MYREFSKKWKCEHTNKLYKHNPEFVLENETYKLFWDFETQTDRLISARRLDIVIVNKEKKRTFRIVDIAVPADHRVKLKENEKKKKKNLDLARELKKLRNINVTVIPIVIGAFGTVAKGLVQGLEDVEKRGRAETIQTTALFKIGQNTEKSPGGLKTLAVTQTPVSNHHLTLV